MFGQSDGASSRPFLKLVVVLDVRYGRVTRLLATHRNTM